jgi:methionyl-tRNA formyltransferase
MRIVFIGTGEIGVPTLRALQTSSDYQLVGAVTQPDKPVGRDQKITAPPIKAALAGAKMPILQPKRIKDPPSFEEIRALQPDVIVVMAYGQILPRDVLQIPPVACLNLHASLLPRWRGAAPIQAAIAAGDRETGITVMYMDEGLDTGDILLQHKIDISPLETGGSLHDRLGEIAPDALLEALSLLVGKKAPRVRQDATQATLAPKLDREDGRIDWMEPAQAIERKIRAFNPWPGAFTVLTGEPNKPRKLKIYSASIVDLNGQPGEILQGKDEMVIATGRQSLSLIEVQLEGKSRMSVSEFTRGFPSDRWIGRAGDIE